MTAASSTPRSCIECGKEVPQGKRKYCDTTCMYRFKGKAKVKPCVDCGGPKGDGKGRRRCPPCDEARAPAFALAQLERGRRRSKERRLSVPPEERRQVLVKDWPEGQGWCARCKRFLPLSRFRPDPKRPGGFASGCNACRSEYAHAYQIKKAFGITLEQYDLMYDFQDGRCFICQSKPRTQRLAVDHNHKTGEIRGLLCKRCNRDLLGKARDDVNILRRAVQYLENPPAREALLAENGDAA